MDKLPENQDFSSSDSDEDELQEIDDEITEIRESKSNSNAPDAFKIMMAAPKKRNRTIFEETSVATEVSTTKTLCFDGKSEEAFREESKQ